MDVHEHADADHTPGVVAGGRPVCRRARCQQRDGTSSRGKPAEAKAVREIRARVEMFVGDWVLDRQTGVSLRLHPPVQREVVLVADKLCSRK